MMAMKPKPFGVGTRVFKRAGGGKRIGIIDKTVEPKTWEVKFFDSKVIETLRSSQLLRPKDPPAEAPAEAIIQAVLHVLSGHDSKGSDEAPVKAP
jgi:hypothetical protein